MSHNVESMMYVGRVPWHKLGTYVGDKEITSTEAIVLSGQDWEVELKTPCHMTPSGPVECPDHKVVVRITDNKPLGIVGLRYTPVQNKQAFNFFDEVVGRREAIYHTAGSLHGGKKIWILAKLPDDIIVETKGNEDRINQFLLFTNSHDGTSTVRMLFTPIRVVCQNTLNAAMRGRRDGVNIRHTKTVHQKINQARQILGFAREHYKEFGEIAQRMAEVQVTSANFDEYLEKLFTKAETEEASTRTKNVIADIKHLHETGTVKPFHGTVWGMYNAVAEYADHYKTVKGKGESALYERKYIDNVLTSIWFGSGLQLKQKAFDEAFELVRR
ncbi:MAG: DUF932 domain-containing protein [Nitrospira sp.]|nr:DUF932 domain-containing protein [Nitrospira sp.]